MMILIKVREYFFYVDHHGRLFQVQNTFMWENLFHQKCVQIHARMIPECFIGLQPWKKRNCSSTFSRGWSSTTLTDTQNSGVSGSWHFPFFLSLDMFFLRFISLCGKERNFVRCDDRPIVFHNSKILPTPSGKTVATIHKIDSLLFTATFWPGDSWHLLHNHAGEKLAVLFQPQLISMVPSTGDQARYFCSQLRLTVKSFKPFRPSLPPGSKR